MIMPSPDPLAGFLSTGIPGADPVRDPLEGMLGGRDASGFVIYGAPERRRAIGDPGLLPPPDGDKGKGKIAKKSWASGGRADASGGSADELRGRFAHVTAAAKAHDQMVDGALRQRNVDLALGKGAEPGTVGTDYAGPWGTWLEGYYKFAAANVPDYWSDDAAIGAQLSSYEHELEAWIQRFQVEARPSAAPVPFKAPESPPPKGGLLSPGAPGGRSGLDSLGDFLGEAKWWVVGGLVLYLALPLLPALASASAGLASRIGKRGGP